MRQLAVSAVSNAALALALALARARGAAGRPCGRKRGAGR
jgi:hypothetical protein